MKKERMATLPTVPLATLEEQNSSDSSVNDKPKEKDTKNHIMEDIEHKVHSMDSRMESLSVQMDNFRKDVLAALQMQNSNKNTQVEYIWHVAPLKVKG